MYPTNKKPILSKRFRHPTLYEDDALSEFYANHNRQLGLQLEEFESLVTTANLAEKAAKLAYAENASSIVAYKRKIEDFREFKRGYEAEVGGPRPRQVLAAASQAEFGWEPGVDDVPPPAYQLARQEVVSLAKLTSLKRKNPGTETLPEEAPRPPRKKICKRRTQDHCDRPDWRCVLCGFISKNHHVHRHLRSKTLPLHDIQDILKHDAYMVKVELGSDPVVAGGGMPHPVNSVTTRIQSCQTGVDVVPPRTEPATPKPGQIA